MAAGPGCAMFRIRWIACSVAALAIIGCSNSRPDNVAANPGECYCELSNPEVVNDKGELKFKVRYAFPDGPPKYEAWFACTFEIMGSSTSSVTVRKMGKDLQPVGEFEGKTNAQFLRTLSGQVAVTVKQAATKNGPYNNVSARLVADF